MAFKYLPDVAIADIAVEITSKDLNGLFVEAGKAICDLQVNPKDVKLVKQKRIKLTNTAIDKLFFDWIAELIYLKDAEHLLLKEFTVVVKETKDGYRLDATAKGAKINYKTMKLRNDLKAITYHMFEVKQEKKGWKAMVVVDI